MARRQTFHSASRRFIRHLTGATAVLPLVGTCVTSVAQQSQSPAGMLLNRRAVAYDAVSHAAFAVDQANARVWMIDGETGERRSIAVGQEPEALAIDSSAGRVYVANAGSGSVSVIDEHTGRVVSTLQAGPHPYAIAVNTMTHTVYVSNTFSDEIALIDGATGEVAMHKWASADDIAVDAQQGAAFLLGYEDVNLSVLRQGNAAPEKIPVGNHLWSMVADPSAAMLYVTQVGSARVVAVDEKTGKATAIPTGAFPCAVAINHAAHRVYTANYGDDTVTIIDGTRRQVMATVTVGSHPQAIAVDERAHLVYVANSHSDSVTVLDAETGKVRTTLPAGSRPYALAVNETGHKVYIANMGDPAFTVIDTTGLVNGGTDQSR